MGTERLALAFERQDDGSVLLRVSGRLERATAAVLDGVLRGLRTTPAPVTVDLTDVDHIDAHGLEVLLDAEADARMRRTRIDVIGVRESLRLRRSPLDQ